jgi:hypothetical protein
MNDQYEGQGGSYVVGESGARTLVERTRNPGDAPAEPTQDPAPTAQDTQPASAGFSLPEAPADQSTAE